MFNEGSNSSVIAEVVKLEDWPTRRGIANLAKVGMKVLVYGAASYAGPGGQRVLDAVPYPEAVRNPELCEGRECEYLSTELQPLMELRRHNATSPN